jgi:hypothetical protein
MPKGLKQFQKIEEQEELIEMGISSFTTHGPWNDINIDEIKRVMEDFNKYRTAVLRPLHSIEVKFKKNPCIPSAVTNRVQFRCPRSKKKRMRRKWAKNQKNWKTIERDMCIMIGNILHVHPSRIDAVRRAFEDNIFEREITFMDFDELFMTPFTEPFRWRNNSCSGKY